MDLSGEYRFDAPRQAVWDLLMNSDAIARAIPGVDEFIPIEGESHAWRAQLNVALATVKGSYGGTVRIEDIDAPSQYRLIASGEGQQSIIGGSVRLHLEEDKEMTLLTWEAEAQISGKLARVGQRVIKAAATMMSNRFFQGIEDQLSEEIPSE